MLTSLPILEGLGRGQWTYLPSLKEHHPRRPEKLYVIVLSTHVVSNSNVTYYRTTYLSQTTARRSARRFRHLACVPSCRRTYANLKTSSNNVQGTLRWMAIEQFSDTTPGAHEQYSFATDIWSFGMTIYVRPARFCKPPPPAETGS